MTTNSVSHCLAKSVEGISLREYRYVERAGSETALGRFFDQENGFANGLPSLMCVRFDCVVDSNHAAVVHQQQGLLATIRQKKQSLVPRGGLEPARPLSG